MKTKVFVADGHNGTLARVREELDGVENIEIVEFVNSNQMESFKQAGRDGNVVLIMDLIYGLSLVLTGKSEGVEHNLELIRECKKLYPQISILVWTKGNEQQREEATKAGADVVIQKFHRDFSLKKAIFPLLQK